MNHYKIEVRNWSNAAKATEGANAFIEQCNKDGETILDIITHVTETEDYMSYVFIFKLKAVVEANELDVCDINF